MAEPSFAMFWAHQVPKWVSDDGLSKATVYYGNYILENKNPNQAPPDSWSANDENDVAVIHLTIHAGGKVTIPKAHGGAQVNRAFYLIEGSGRGFTMNGFPAKGKMTTVDASVDLTLELCSGTLQLLMLQGKPIGEPVSQSGPFVMNTPEEVQQAELDYGETQFGGWPWPQRDMVFPREKSRFSLLNGIERVPDE